ncbi:endonuclease/exonuclease/phosphatase family protein [Pontiella agarivorans]|uniref:Endonuclease/exonuclease/phosphatase family protein n=1 Tax=Pontiella agarivorans TaxID=3038953 RepID=A0ABU5MVE2_9BACT|nr:endonuclease/exonuclease/phosphatase family protein [Pontiella agarivorans]MDZ8118078.1 endonuclease/exonuclease/phosphatase family protein [Pontiella agarivorans]
MSEKTTRKRSLNPASAIDFIALGLVAATVFGFLGRLHWFLDLFSHFRVQYMQLCLPIIGIYLWKRMNKKGAAMILLAAINYALVLPLYFGKPDAPTKEPIRAMLMNINALNGNTDEVLSAIHDADPDILLLEEVTPKWDNELRTLNDAYPHHIEQPRDDCFGIKLFSKLPLSKSEIKSISERDVPTILTTIHTPQGEISFIGTHPLPPIGKAYSESRNLQLRALPDLVKNQPHPVLLIGDLNTSPWSPHFQRLEKESGLKNSMKGFGFQPSWPADRFFLKIPIDHVLYSEEITIHNRMTGKRIGSDHLPIIVDFTFAQ